MADYRTYEQIYKKKRLVLCLHMRRDIKKIISLKNVTAIELYLTICTVIHFGIVSYGILYRKMCYKIAPASDHIVKTNSYRVAEVFYV